MNQLSDKDLECLNLWPPGTVDWGQDAAMLTALNALCRAHGYDRVSQLARCIEELSRDPTKAAGFEQLRRQHFREMGWPQVYRP